LNTDEQKKTEEFIKRVRLNILKFSLAAGSDSAHIGGALSCSDIVGVLYKKYINVDGDNFENRNRFILSKGHACLALYSCLVEIGLISQKEIETFEKNESKLLGHPVINRSIGIEFSTGSLGMGLSLGIGVALSFKKSKKENHVFILLGDGECNEGSIWEAAMCAAHFKLNNITCFIDNNNFQQTGTNQQIMNNSNIKDKWKSFDWDVYEINGHNVKEINEHILKETNKPKLILAKTIKGKGLKIAEGNNSWHHSIITKQQYEEAVKYLK
tara:strand:- start:31 stop:840 length:810 start_codon:yes stop_codon:yes gene_type:complete